MTSPSGVSGMTETPERPKLLPCPFCGGEAQVGQDLHAIGQPWLVYCLAANACEVEVEASNISREKAIADWNRAASSLGEPVSQEAPWTYRPQDARYPFLNQIIVDGAGKDVTSVLCISTAEKIVNAANRASRSAFSGIPRTENEHRCGVRGFDGMKGDVCPACSVISSASPLSEDERQILDGVRHDYRLGDSASYHDTGNLLAIIDRLSASAPSPE
jgi:hypothetical protein